MYGLRGGVGIVSLYEVFLLRRFAQLPVQPQIDKRFSGDTHRMGTFDKFLHQRRLDRNQVRSTTQINIKVNIFGQIVVVCNAVCVPELLQLFNGLEFSWNWIAGLLIFCHIRLTAFYHVFHAATSANKKDLLGLLKPNRSATLPRLEPIRPRDDLAQEEKKDTQKNHAASDS